MIPISLHRRSARRGLPLLILAVVAHLGLGVISTTHLVRMLSPQVGFWAEICSLYGVKRTPATDASSPSGDQGIPQGGIQVDCPLCSVASTAAPPAAPAALIGSGTVSLISQLRLAADDSISQFVGLSPLPRGPPQLS